MSGHGAQSPLQAKPTSDPAKKLCILVVEDEGMVAMLIEDMLTHMGHEVGAVVSRMEEALQIAKTGSFDLAIIDVNLDGQPSYPVAELLTARGIPFVFATGYGRQGVDPKFAQVPTLAKPFVSKDLAKLLSQTEPRL
ncbi:MAG TPA: response regulator [Stellaceae bacterium]|nr:response regulator [Stellaceae bacterium]